MPFKYRGCSSPNSLFQSRGRHSLTQTERGSLDTCLIPQSFRYEGLQQRMLVAGKPYFVGKPAAAVCLCRRGGATAAFQTLQMPFQMLNMPIVTSQYWNIAYGREEGQVAQDVEGLQTMRTLANNMAWLLKKIKGIETTDVPEYEPWTPLSFIR